MLAVVLLAVPATPALLRFVLLFYADFDAAMSTGPGGDDEFAAVGGKITITGATNVFSVQPQGVGGVLVVGANPTATPAVMLAELADPTDVAEVHVGLTLRKTGAATGLVVGMLDDDSGGMIDIEFNDDDTITVGGVHDQLPASAGNSTMELQVVFRESVLGPKTWKASLKGPWGGKTWQGLLLTPGPLNLGEIVIVRPGLTTGGQWVLDDLVVSTPLGLGSSSQ